MKYKLICEDSDFCITLEFQADYIGEVFEKFEMFLQGVGFYQGNINDYLNKATS